MPWVFNPLPACLGSDSTCFSTQNEHMHAFLPCAVHSPFQKTISPIIIHINNSFLQISDPIWNGDPHALPLSIAIQEIWRGLDLHSFHSKPTLHSITYSPFFIHTPTPFLSILSHFTEIISSSPCHTHLHHSWRSHFTLGELAPKVTLKGSSTQFAPRGSSFS